MLNRTLFHCMNRRQLLGRVANGIGWTALTALLAEEARAAGSSSPAHPAAKAKHMIFLYQFGGPSHVDSFDPKPKLAELHGKKLDGAVPHARGLALAPQYPFRPRGRSGLEISDLLPGIAAHADELCVLRSVVTDSFDHAQAMVQLMTGEARLARPSLGSWLLYGLGSENKNLPGFISLNAAFRDSSANYAASLLPASFQGTQIHANGQQKELLPNLTPLLSSDAQRRQLDLMRQLNELHRTDLAHDSRLNARIEAAEMAFRMQSHAPEAFDLAQETAHTQKVYGLDNPVSAPYGRGCLVARRLIERGVRFVHVNVPGGNWDQHSDLKDGHRKQAEMSDVPVGGLLQDLKQRGLLDQTLVLWAGEFGRTPGAEGSTGRDHHPRAFSVWFAGGGVKKGFAYGRTDEFGWNVVENKVHIHDLHATILWLMGLDHEKLTYRHSGRDYRLTDVHGRVVHDIIA